MIFGTKRLTDEPPPDTNRLSDPFEWALMKKTLDGVCLLFVVVQVLSLTVVLWPGMVPNPNLPWALTLRLLALAADVVVWLAVQSLRAPSVHLTTGAIAVVVANLATNLGLTLGGRANLFVAQGDFMAVTVLYVFLFGFFCRSRTVNLVFGMGLLTFVVVVFALTKDLWFPEPLTAGELGASLVVIQVFVVVESVVLVALYNFHSQSVMTRSRSLARDLERLAFSDLDTNLPNAHRFEADVRSFQPARLPPKSRLALVGLRLLGLDELNERRGLQFTNELVSRVARRLHQALEAETRVTQSFLPPEGLEPLYRIEGSTFAAWLGLPENEVLGDPLQRRVEQILDLENVGLDLAERVSFRGGISLFPNDGDSLATVERNVLGLLHDNAGRTLRQFYPFNADAHRAQVRRNRIKDKLTHALENRQIRTVFQPQIRLNDGAVAGFEALARWTDPELGAVSPVEFIPLAERTGHIETLTLGVLGEALDLLDQREAGSPALTVAINLTPTLLHDRFLAGLLQRLQTSRWAAFIELEITEGTALVADSSVQAALGKIQELGVNLAIDDFGTGYSNLAHLQNLAADVLKIDKQFIDSVPGEPTACRLVEAMVKMAKALNLTVVGEGAETREQVEFLRSSGCDLVQGYFFSAPLEKSEALAYRGPDLTRLPL